MLEGLGVGGLGVELGEDFGVADVGPVAGEFEGLEGGAGLGEGADGVGAIKYLSLYVPHSLPRRPERSQRVTSGELEPQCYGSVWPVAWGAGVRTSRLPDSITVWLGSCAVI